MGGEHSKGSGKESKASANDLSEQIVQPQSGNATEDAALELKTLEVVKTETEEKIKEVSVMDNLDAEVQGEDQPSGQIVAPQSDNATDGAQSKKLTINGVEWKQWIKNLLLPFK